MNGTDFDNSTVLSNATNPALNSLRLPLLLWFIADATIVSIGIFSNVVMLLVIFLYKPFRESSSSVLIAHCVCIDLYTCCISDPIQIIPLFLGPTYPRSVQFCRFFPIFVTMCYPLGGWSAFAVAFHRMVAALAPIQFEKLKKPPALAALVIAPWIATYFIMGWQPVATAQYKMIPAEAGGCRYYVNNQPAAMASVTFGTYFPVSCTGLCYVIFLAKTCYDYQRKERSPAMRRRMEISRMLMLSFMWHVCSIVPVVTITSGYSALYGSNEYIRLSIRWLMDCYSALNPIFMCAASKLIQDGVKEIFGRCCGWKNQANRASIQPIPQVQSNDSAPSTKASLL